MRIGRIVCVALLAAAAGSSFGESRVTTDAPSKGSEQALRALFPSEADVFIEASGLVRLDLPPEVIAKCRPDLSNVRLFNRGGIEIPFLLDSPRMGVARETETVQARPLELHREEIRRENGPPLRRETYDIDAPARSPRSGAWSLVVDATQRSFVVSVEISSTTGSAVARGSIFRLTSPRAVEKLRIPLPALATGRLRVSLSHEQDFWLEPGFRYESSATIAFGSTTTVPLAILSQHSSGGSTVIELARPRGVVPEALRIATGTPMFDRTVSVHDEGPVRDASPLGAGNAFRLIPGTGVEDLDISTRPARGDRLRIVIDDGDSPPLADLSFAAVFAKPSLVASLEAPPDSGPAAVLCFGGDRARVPRYDLAGLIGDSAFGIRAEALLQLYDPASMGKARLGPIRANAAFDPTPALAFAMRPGAEIDSRLWSKRRPLSVQPSAEGLSHVRLSPEDLAVLRQDLGDLRIVDDSSRQWPYLVDRDVAAADVLLSIGDVNEKDRATIYRLDASNGTLTVDQIRLDIDAPFFDRPFELTGRLPEGGERTLANGRLQRRAGDSAPVTLSFPSTAVKQLELRIENGDDASLALRAASARVHLPDVYLAAPAGSYWMLLGATDAESPRYEIERVRDVVLAVEAVPVDPGAVESNPKHSAAARLVKGKGREQALLWIVVIAAVVVLAALTLRLARREAT